LSLLKLNLFYITQTWYWFDFKTRTHIIKGGGGGGRRKKKKKKGKKKKKEEEEETLNASLSSKNDFLKPKKHTKNDLKSM
jgi:hypothetical protein